MILYDCSKIQFLLNIIGYLFNIIQWVIPIFLIILVTIDVAKIVVDADEKKKEESMKKIGKRVMYAAILFLIPLLIRLMFSSFGNHVDSYDSTWIDCFYNAIHRRK